MPVTKTKLPGGKVRVSTPHGVKAKATTPAKAAAQERLLNAVEHGWKPTGQKAMQDRSTKGSPPMRSHELTQGHRKMGTVSMAQLNRVGRR